MLNMKAGESVTEYFARTMTVVNKMRSNGAKNLTDVSIIEKILRSMTRNLITWSALSKNQKISM